VPKKEGKPLSVNTIYHIWRGHNHKRQLHLLDNDFFGQPEDQWRARLDEIRTGNFAVCFNQGLNIRLITEATAEALSTVRYRDDSFKRRRLYTAWDNLKDEGVFFRGVDTLQRAGIQPRHLMAYMLVGYDPRETMDSVLYRFHRMTALGIRPYPMVYDRSKTVLRHFQRWANTGLYRAVKWEDYVPNARAHQVPAKGELPLFSAALANAA